MIIDDSAVRSSFIAEEKKDFGHEIVTRGKISTAAAVREVG